VASAASRWDIGQRPMPRSTAIITSLKELAFDSGRPERNEVESNG